MKIYIPHIHYTIKVKNIKSLKTKFHAYAQQIDIYTAEIYLPLPLKVKDYPTVGHEIIHVLQYISETRGIDFVNEKEHFGYLFQFIFNKITGFTYETPY